MSLTTTYLDLVNDVLVRLREAQVASVSQNTYSALIGKLLNDAKREVEDSWNWDTLRNTISFTTQQGTFNYNLANAGNKFRVIAHGHNGDFWTHGEYPTFEDAKQEVDMLPISNVDYLVYSDKNRVLYTKENDKDG